MQGRTISDREAGEVSAPAILLLHRLPGSSTNYDKPIPRRPARSGKHVVEVNFNTAAGNHAVIETAPHRFVLYAHMRPGD